MTNGYIMVHYVSSEFEVPEMEKGSVLTGRNWLSWSWRPVSFLMVFIHYGIIPVHIIVQSIHS